MSIPEIPSIMNHVSVGTNQLPEALVFYDEVLATVGARRVFEVTDHAVAYGKEIPEFWVHPPYDGQKAMPGNGAHFAFYATSEDMVNRFYQVAMEHGAQDEGEPGPRPLYGPQYYGCFVRDLDGNKIECALWDESRANQGESK